MLIKKIQVNYYIKGRKVFNQSGETDIQTIEANKLFLEKMFSIICSGSEIEVIGESISNLNGFPILSPCLN